MGLRDCFADEKLTSTASHATDGSQPLEAFTEVDSGSFQADAVSNKVQGRAGAGTRSRRGGGKLPCFSINL